MRRVVLLFMTDLIVRLFTAAPALADLHANLQDWAPRGRLLWSQVLFLKALPFAAFAGLLLGAYAGRRACQARRQPRTGNGNDAAVPRHAPMTILAHWLNAVGIMTCIGTGLIQYRVLWLTAPLDRVYQVHFIGASLVVFAVALYLGRQISAASYAVLWRRGDLGMLWDMLRDTLRTRTLRRGEDSQLGGEKYSPYSRVVSFPIWSIIIALALTTGMLKAFRYTLLPLPGSVLYAVSAVHVATLFLAGAKLFEHLLRYLALPSHWPLLKSMFGRPLQRDYVQNRYPAWYRALQEQASADVAPSSPGSPSNPGEPSVASPPSK